MKCKDYIRLRLPKQKYSKLNNLGILCINPNKNRIFVQYNRRSVQNTEEKKIIVWVQQTEHWEMFVITGSLL